MKTLKDIPFVLSIPCAALCTYITITSIATGSSPEIFANEYTLMREHSDERIASYDAPIPTLRDDEPVLFWFKTGIFLTLSVFNLNAIRARHIARNRNT